MASFSFPWRIYVGHYSTGSVKRVFPKWVAMLLYVQYLLSLGGKSWAISLRDTSRTDYRVGESGIAQAVAYKEHFFIFLYFLHLANGQRVVRRRFAFKAVQCNKKVHALLLSLAAF